MLKYEDKIKNLLKLDKPLVIFDIEATGPVFSKDRIVKLAYIKISPGKKITLSEELLINPEMEISREATEVHGVKDEDVKGRPTFKEAAQKLWEVFHNSYYGGYSITNFDLPLLKREFLRAGMDFNYKYEEIIDSRVIFNYMEPRNISFAYKYYCDKDLDHGQPMSEVKAMIEIFKKQLKRHEELRSLEFIKKIHRAKSDRFVDSTVKFYWHRGEAYFAFGKYKERPLSEIVIEDSEFLKWILEADFSEETKNIITEALKAKPKKRKAKEVKLPL